MSPQGTSSLPPNKTVGRRVNHTVTHSRRRLDRLTKVAVESAYKLHTESRRLVHIVETQSCGDSTRLGCSNPFFSLPSALLKTSSSTTPSPSKNWALSKDSSDRCSVAARIHALLNQWRADASSEWRTRVASVVPILEEVLYKEATSQEEYTNPQLLESQLMNVLCHFEAGNGPFLLQGSSPLYPVRACIPPSSSSNSLSPLCQHALGQGVSENGNSCEIAFEETHERARFTCTQSPALASGPISTGAIPSHSQANDTIQTICDPKVSTDKNGGSHTSSKIVKKVAAMLSKKRKEKGKCLKQGLERDDQGAESVERCIINSEMEAVGRVEANNDGMTCEQSPLNSCRGNGRMRSTLGGILEFDVFSMESSSVISAEASPLSPLSTNDGTSHNVISNSRAEASDQAYIVDSQLADALGLSYLHSSLGQIVHLDQGRGVNCERKAMSQFPLASTPSPCSSASSLSSSSASPPIRSLSCSPSAPSMISAEARPLSLLSTNDETSRNIISNSRAEASDRAYIGDSQLADAGELSYLHSSLGQIVHLDKGQGASCERKAMSQFPLASTPSPRSSSSSASSSSESPPGRSLSCSPSSPAQLSSASTPSPSLPHQAPSMLQVGSSSSTPQENSIHTSRTCLKAMPQHQSSASSQQLALMSASSDVPSVKLNYAQLLMCKDRQNRAPSNYNRTDVLLRARQGKEQAAQIAFEQSRTQITSEEPRKIERGESSSTSSTSSLPSESNEELFKTREKKVKLPLRSFLAEREEYMGCKSSYKKGGPWDTWEEATEQLDVMCCVCMVGLKGAAFVPCGHTFCRKCSRELWRSRGTCPLCNRYIREILDIY